MLTSASELVLPPLRLTHFHVKVTDLDGALDWFQRVCATPPSFRKGPLAYLKAGGVVLVLEGVADGEAETQTTIAFASDDCDRDFATLVARGAKPLAGPESKPWGVRGAYVAGPGRITFELEQSLN